MRGLGRRVGGKEGWREGGMEGWRDWASSLSHCVGIVIKERMGGGRTKGKKNKRNNRGDRKRGEKKREGSPCMWKPLGTVLIAKKPRDRERGRERETDSAPS